MHKNDKIEALLKTEVEYTLRCLPEWESPEGNFDSGNDAEDAEICRKIREDLDNGNQWAWCTVEVVASWKGISARDFLGCCCYASEKQFREDGYFEDMKASAFDSLVKQVISLQIEV